MEKMNIKPSSTIQLTDRERLTIYREDLERREVRLSGVSLELSRFGIGLFATTPFEPRQEILRFEGEPINKQQAIALGDSQCYALQVSKNRYINLFSPGRFVNHSCQPNAGVVARTLIAIRYVRPGDEIFFDYSTTMDEDYWSMQCRCGSKACRHSIGDFKRLGVATRNHYLELGVVPRFAAVAALAADRVRVVS